MIDGYYRRKHVRGVAVFTHIGCQNMCRVLTDCVRAVVAAKTVSRNVYVIEICRQPGDRAVAVIAVVAARYVSRVFAGGGNTVVAGSASTQNLRVIDRNDGNERNRAVAVFANVRRQRVRWGFSGCVRAVMAVAAVTRDAGMVEVRG